MQSLHLGEKILKKYLFCFFQKNSPSLLNDLHTHTHIYIYGMIQKLLMLSLLEK